MSEPVLQVKGLKTYYYTEEGVVPAVDGLDFEVEPGETFAIVGESGCGKSVTSLSILRLIPSPPGKIIDGEIIYHGQDLVKKSEREMRSIRGNDISMIFQEPMTSLNPVFTVGQQIGESFRFHQLYRRGRRPRSGRTGFRGGAGRNVCYRRRKRLRQVCDLAVHPAPDSLAARQNY